MALQLFDDGQSQTLQPTVMPMVTPASLAARRNIALAMLKEGADYSPIRSPWQGVARVADAIMGGYQAHRLDQQELAGRQAASSGLANAIAGAFGGGTSSNTFPPAPGSTPSDATINAAPSAAANSPTPSVAGNGDPITQYGNAIASIESDGSGGYSALGPTTKTGDRAYGRYQVMGSNIPEWTQAALGHPMTPQQFLADPKAQDAVFANRFGGYVQQYGNPQDAASAWFTGQPLSRGGGAADQLGTTGNAYVSKFNRALGQPTQVASLDPSAGIASATGPSATVPPEFASKGITQAQWDAMNAPDGATSVATPAFAPTPDQAPIPTPSPNGPGSDLYIPPSMPAPYDSMQQAIPAPTQADAGAAISRLMSGQPQQFPPEFGAQDIAALKARPRPADAVPFNGPPELSAPAAGGGSPALPPQAPVPTSANGYVPAASGAMTPAGQRALSILSNPAPLSGKDGVIQALSAPGGSVPPASAPVPASPGAANVAAAMNGGPSNLPVTAGGSADAISPMGVIGGNGRMGMDPSQISAISSAMANPWMSDGQQQLLGSVLSSRLTPHKIEMVPLGNGDTAEVDSITGQQVGQIHGIKPPVAMGYDQRLVDPMTGQQVGGGPQNGQLPFRFMTPLEKQAAGLPLDTPIQVGPDGKMVQGGVTVNTGTPEASYNDKMAGAIADQHAALAGGVESAQQQIQAVHAMQGALQQIQANGGTTGMGEAEVTKLKSLINTGANALGVDQPFDISNQEGLNSFGRIMAGAMAKAGVGARVTNFELGNYLKSNPGQELSPQGNFRLLGIKEQILQRNIEVGQQIRDLSEQAIANGQKINPAQTEKIIRDYDAAHHIMDPITGQDLTQNVKLKDSGKSGANGTPATRPRATNSQGQSVEWDGTNWVPVQ